MGRWCIRFLASGAWGQSPASPRAPRTGSSYRLVVFPSWKCWIVWAYLNNNFPTGNIILHHLMPFWFPGWILVSSLGPTFCCVPKARDVSGCLEWLVAHSGSVHQILGQDFRIKASEGNQGARRYSCFHVFPYWCFFLIFWDFFGIETSMVFFPHERCQKLMRPNMTTSDYHRYHDLWMSLWLLQALLPRHGNFPFPCWLEHVDTSAAEASFALPAAVYLLINVLTVAAARMLHLCPHRIYLLLLTVVDFHD